VARRSKSNSRAAQRREEAAIKLLVVGAGLVILPLVLRASPPGKAFMGLIPIGIVLLAAGAAFLWLGRQGGKSIDRLARPTLLDARPEPMDNLTPEPWSADRPVAEFERAAAEAKSAPWTPPERPTTWSAKVFDVIEWRRFEAVVETLFQQAGLATKSQSHGADGGVDVWLYSRAQPETPVGIVQCKHWQSKPVGVDKIRELRGVMAANKVGRGVFVATSGFTADAAKFGKDNGIDLLDVNKLLSMFANRTTEEQKALLDVALEGEYWCPTCASCGIKLVKRTSGKDGSKFWGCRNFPGCRTTLPMRTT
jgi:restriction system protein